MVESHDFFTNLILTVIAENSKEIWQKTIYKQAG